jgi:hypothetical protein
METQVECHSDYCYEQRPVAFHWEEEWIQVETLIAEWKTPEGKGFRVQSGNGQIFELFYHQQRDQWEVQQN